MRQPVLGNAAERAGDADDLAGRILVESLVLGQRQAGGDCLAALLDETDEIVGQSTDSDSKAEAAYRSMI